MIGIGAVAWISLCTPYLKCHETVCVVIVVSCCMIIRWLADAPFSSQGLWSDFGEFVEVGLASGEGEEVTVRCR